MRDDSKSASSLYFPGTYVAPVFHHISNLYMFLYMFYFKNLWLSAALQLKASYSSARPTRRSHLDSRIESEGWATKGA